MLQKLRFESACAVSLKNQGYVGSYTVGSAFIK